MQRRTMISHSEEESLCLGEELGRNARRGTVYALRGDLGSGKTVLARGIARGLGITDNITSPTFTLLEIYEGALPLYHFDLYRIEKTAEFDGLGFEEYWEGDGVSVIEWAERADGLLPDSTVVVFLEYRSERERKISIEYPGD